MKHAFAWMMALAFITPQNLHAEGHLMTEDQANVLAAVEAMTSHFQNKDIEAVMRSYEDVATVAFEPGEPVSDADQLVQMFTGMASVDPVFDYAAGHDVIVNGDLALHIAPWSMSGRGPDGEALAQEGLSVAVLRRQTDGTWKLVIDNPHGGRLLAPSR